MLIKYGPNKKMKIGILRNLCCLYLIFAVLVTICLESVNSYDGESNANGKSASQRSFYKAWNLLHNNPFLELSNHFSRYGHGYSIGAIKLKKGVELNKHHNIILNHDFIYNRSDVLLPWKLNVLQTVKNDLGKLENEIRNMNYKTVAVKRKKHNYISKSALKKRVIRQAEMDNNQTRHYNTTIKPTESTTLLTSKQIFNEQVYDTEGSGSISEDNVTFLHDTKFVIKNDTVYGHNITDKGDNSIVNGSMTSFTSQSTQNIPTNNTWTTKVLVDTEPPTLNEPVSIEPISEPETTPEPLPEPTPESNSFDKFNTTLKEYNTTSETSTQLETSTHSEPESLPEVSSTAEPETSSEPMSLSETITSSEPKSEPKSTPEPLSTPEPSSEPKLKTSSAPVSSSEPEPESTSEPKTTSEPVTKSEPESTSEPKTKSEPATKAEPKSTSEPETTPEPATNPEKESTPKPESEQESTSNSEPEPYPDSENSFAEPSPIWNVAKEEWKWGWEFLIYFFGVMFILLGIFSFISVVRLWKMNHLLSKNYFLTLNVLIIVKCALRGSYLLVDGYNSKDTFHDILNYFLYSTAFPCLTSAFSILFYALLLATKMQVISTRIQKLPVLIGIIVFHFALSIVTDVVVGVFSDARILLLVCQFFYILWGIVLFVAYFYIFRKLFKSAVKRQKTLAQRSSSNNSNEKPRKFHSSKYTLSLSVKVTFLAALFGLGCVALELYGIFGVYKIYLKGHTPEPWPWWIYQFSLRTMEFLMCLTMVYVASQPIKYQRRKGDGTFSLLCMPFNRVCCCCKYNFLNDGESTWASSNAIALPSSNSDQYKLPKYKKNNKGNKNHKNGIYALEKNGSAKPVKLTHIVIEDGRVRFKSEEDITDNSSELGTSLPDLVNGSALKDEILECDNLHKHNRVHSNGVYNVGEFDNLHKHNRVHSNGVYNVGFNEVEGVNNRNGEYYRTPSVENSVNRTPKQSFDLDRTSIGTFGTDIGRPLSSLNLAASMEWEFEKVYERSFVQDETNSIQSMPNVVSLTHSDDLVDSNLLSNRSPSQTDSSQDQGSYSSGPNDSTLSGPNTPTRKPLIQGNGQRSSFDCINSFEAKTKL